MKYQLCLVGYQGTVTRMVHLPDGLNPQKMLIRCGENQFQVQDVVLDVTESPVDSQTEPLLTLIIEPTGEQRSLDDCSEALKGAGWTFSSVKGESV
jgi:hypothetical protein